MKLQFSIVTLLLAVAIAAIHTSGVVTTWQSTNTSFKYLPLAIGATMPIWLPVVFVAYALGRRSLAIPMVIFLAIGEAAAVALACWLHRNF